MIELERNGDVHVLRMVAGENRFNATFMAALNQALDDVQDAEGPAALVTTGEGKFYSNGLDLEWMGSAAREEVRQHVENVHNTFIRMLTFPMITVAALNGHVFAAGAMLSLAHDYRVMRADRGFFCLPEVDIRIPFTEQMDALIRARLPKMVAHEAMVTARRYGGSEAAARQIVDHAVSETELLPKAIEIAQGLAGKDRDTIAVIKRQMYADVIDVFAGELSSEGASSR
jgi:enoyl-CoA hydratase/carnithine racemase